MCQLTFPNTLLPPSYIAESSPQQNPPFEPDPLGWTDEEIATIRSALQKLTSIRIFNSNDVEDLVQETLLTMISKPPETVLKKGPLVWGMGILRRKVGNYYRKSRRYISLNERNAENPLFLHTLSPEGKLYLSEMETIVKGVLSQLPVSQKRALDLMLAGFNAGEIARLLHPVRYQNVINSLHRGRKKLAHELERHGYSPHRAAGMEKMKISRGKTKSLR